MEGWTSLVARLVVVLACPLVFASGPAHRPTHRPALPAMMLWAWERSEDFRFLKPGEAGVAFLARTVALGPRSVQVRSRRNPLVTTPGTALVAVVRLELHHAKLEGRQVVQVAAAIHDLWALPGIQGLQIDFDATRSQRPFYRELLRRLRASQPRGLSLSMTALGSWCLGDPWIRDLPVDEAVPMLFRMGPESNAVRQALARQGDFTVPLARTSVGFSLDEAFLPVPRGRRIYIFNPQSWTERDFRTVKARLGP